MGSSLAQVSKKGVNKKNQQTFWVYSSDGPFEVEAHVSKKITHSFRSTVSRLGSFGESHMMSDV